MSFQGRSGYHRFSWLWPDRPLQRLLINPFPAQSQAEIQPIRLVEVSVAKQFECRRNNFTNRPTAPHRGERRVTGGSWKPASQSTEENGI
jgi:hypothetical protein